jgi:hypothetical protein
MEARIDANNENSEALQSTLISQMDIHQVRKSVHSRRNESQDGYTSREDGGCYTLHPV